MFLYRADYLKYDFIPMNKRIRRVYGQNLNDTVCVVDPVMRGLGVDLDAVAGSIRCRPDIRSGYPPERR